MNRRLFVGTVAFVGFLVVFVLALAQTVTAGLPPEDGFSASTSEQGGALPRTGRDDITYPLQEGFEDGDFGPSLFHSEVASCIPGGCGWILDSAVSRSGTFSAFAPEKNNVSDQRLVLDNPIAIPIDAISAKLEFWHQYSFEAPNYDGSVLEFSTDNGASWTDVLSVTQFLTGGYNGTVIGNSGSPLANRQGWVGSLWPFTQVTVDLLPFAGQSVLFRFRFATDACCTGGTAGWGIDDIAITLASPLPCPVIGWDVLAPYPIAIANQAVVAHQGMIYSFGGFLGPNNTSPSNSSFRYNPVSNTWSQIANLPGARGGNRAVSDGTYIYVHGDMDGASASPTLWRYNPQTDT